VVAGARAAGGWEVEANSHGPARVGAAAG